MPEYTILGIARCSTNIRLLLFFKNVNKQLDMSHMQNTVYEDYLNNLTKRMVMPTMIMIWSMSHPLFPQLLLRVPDDVNILDWHPLEKDILIGGRVTR